MVWVHLTSGEDALAALSKMDTADDEDDNLSEAPTEDANEDADSAHSDVESQLSASASGFSHSVIASLDGSALSDFDKTIGKLSAGQPSAKTDIKVENAESDQAASSAGGLRARRSFIRLEGV